MDSEFYIKEILAMKDMCVYNVGYEVEVKFESVHVINLGIKILLDINKIHKWLRTSMISLV